MNYFIYSHSLDGIIFYIGCGAIRPPKKNCHTYGVKYERAYIFAQRQKHWIDYVNGREKEVVVNIIEHHENKIYAFKREVELIQLHKNSVVNIASADPVYQFQTAPVVFEKRIIQKDFSGNIVARYKTFLQAAASMNTISTNAIRNCLIGKQKQAYGYLWSIEHEPLLAKELGLSVNRLAKL